MVRKLAKRIHTLLEDNPFEKYRKSLGNVKPSKLYTCAVCHGHWYGRSLERGMLTGHVNRSPGPWFNKPCSGSHQFPVEILKEDIAITGTPNATDIEKAAEKVHDDWVEHQQKLGLKSRKSPDGTEEYIQPYEDLSHPAKELDRTAVKAVLAALKEDGGGAAGGGGMAVGHGGIAGIGVNRSGQPSNDKFAEPGVDLKKRKKLEPEEETFAGAQVFQVNMDKVMAMKGPKHPRHRYSKYIGADEDAEDIRQAARSHRKNVVLKDKSTGVMTWLRKRG